MSLTHILLVEDNPGDAFLVRSLLEVQGEAQNESPQFNLTHVESLGQALSALEENDFDVVLLDLGLPDCDGMEGLNRLREQAPKLPVVVLTGVDDEALSIQLVQLGAQDYLVKDKITQDWLKTTINHAIARSQRSKIQDQYGQALHETNQALQGRVLDYRNKLSEMSEQLHVLEERSSTDALTGIANRYAFEEFLEREWFQACRDPQPISLIMMDIDFFKPFNDGFGHQQGDHCLRRIAQAFQQAVNRPKDLIARYGGEEFVAILPDTAQTGAVTIATKLGKAVRDLAIEHPYSTISPWVTVSFGIAELTPDLDSSPVELIRQADRALYLSKAGGRDCLTYSATPDMVTRSIPELMALL